MLCGCPYIHLEGILCGMLWQNSGGLLNRLRVAPVQEQLV